MSYLGGRRSSSLRRYGVASLERKILYPPRGLRRSNWGIYKDTDTRTFSSVSLQHLLFHCWSSSIYQLAMRFFRLLLLFTGVISTVSMADLWHRDTGVVHDNVAEDKSHGSTPTTRSQTEHKQLARRHIRVYTAIAKNSSDVAELGKFVRSKVQPGKEGAINTLIRDDKIFGWCKRSVGTVFQLPNPDAIYSRDEGKG
jgi:hypothetical protein